MRLYNLDKYRKEKEQRKKDDLAKKIISDVKDILNVIDKSQKAFSFFKNYTPVIEIIGLMEANKALLQCYLGKYEKTLVQKDEE